MGGRANDPHALAWKRSLPALFIALMAVQLCLYQWPRRWLVSGAPILTLILLQGEAKGNRVLPFAHLWSLFTTLNLAYAVASTSWLLYWIFTAACYPMIFIACLFQFRTVGFLTRYTLRTLMKSLHFIDDKIALFDIPALEIDTDVDGLMAIRGATFSLSTLSFEVHGVEVGIKLSDDLEIAIRTEKVKVSLFRRIEIGHCFANVKGGAYEMTFGHVAKRSKDGDGDALLATAALANRPELIKMKSEMTDGRPPESSSPQAAIDGMKRHAVRNESAKVKYRQMLKLIDDTSPICVARKLIEHTQKQTRAEPTDSDALNEQEILAAICSELHSKPSVVHPPQRSIKVTTLQSSLPPKVQGFMHRLPMTLRLLLCPLSYFHTIKILSITATASGRWIEAMLVQKIYKDHDDTDPSFRRFKGRISTWVTDTNFAVYLGNMVGYAQVPFIPTYDINCRLAFGDVVAYQSFPQEMHLQQVVKLSGVDATFNVPTFLLPHHEHLLPKAPTVHLPEHVGEGKATSTDNESTNGDHFTDAPKDEATVRASVCGHLPVSFNQELLDFIAILVKASKIVDMAQTPVDADCDENDDDGSADVRRLSEIAETLNQKMKHGLTKAVIANEQWLAKLVGKVLRKLEEVSGDFGYSVDIPVKLEGYRNTGWLEVEGPKLLE